MHTYIQIEKKHLGKRVLMASWMKPSCVKEVLILEMDSLTRYIKVRDLVMETTYWKEIGNQVIVEILPEKILETPKALEKDPAYTKMLMDAFLDARRLEGEQHILGTTYKGKDITERLKRGLEDMIRVFGLEYDISLHNGDLVLRWKGRKVNIQGGVPYYFMSPPWDVTTGSFKEEKTND